MSEPKSTKPLSMTVTIQTPRALTTGKDTATRLNLPCSVVKQAKKMKEDK